MLGFSLAIFNAAVIIQEFSLLYRSRFKTGAEKTPKILWYAGLVPGFIYSMASLPASGRRRYGGYIVHLGIVLMFLGFTGKSWTVDKETSMKQGDTYQVERLTIKYVGPRMEVDNNKRMVFADVKVFEGGKEVGKLSPAKFIYKKMPDSPTTEVAMFHSIRDDLYLVVGSINPETKMASLQIHLNPLVGWIWFGCLVLIFGSFICMWPEFEPQESRAWQVARGAGAVTASITLGIILALLPGARLRADDRLATALGQRADRRHEGEAGLRPASLHVRDVSARAALLVRVLDGRRDARRASAARLARGETPESIIDDYVKEYGTASLAIPPEFRA